MGTGLSLLELELWEFARVSSLFVDDEVSLLDLRFRLSPGMAGRGVEGRLVAVMVER